MPELVINALGTPLKDDVLFEVQSHIAVTLMPLKSPKLENIRLQEDGINLQQSLI